MKETSDELPSEEETPRESKPKKQGLGKSMADVKAHRKELAAIGRVANKKNITGELQKAISKYDEEDKKQNKVLSGRASSGSEVYTQKDAEDASLTKMLWTYEDVAAQFLDRNVP